MSIADASYLLIHYPLLLVLLAALPVVYMTPTGVACVRHHPRTRMIATVNTLAGWTVVGWLACLVWALRGRGEPPQWP